MTDLQAAVADDVTDAPRAGGRPSSTGGLLVAGAGAAAYLMPAVYVLLDGGAGPGPVWWVPYLVGLAAFVVDAFVAPASWFVRRVARPALVVCAALTFVLDDLDGIGGVPLAVAAATAGLTLARGTVVAVVAAYVVVVAVSSLAAGPPSFALILTTMYGGLVVFSAFTGYSAASERRLREQHALALSRLTAAHEELRAARDDLAEASREAERLRISRELHDLVGHQLVGLAVHLEVASHLTHGQARVHVDASRDAAKALLADVRTVVARLRDDVPTDLGRALRAVADAVPSPRVVLAADDVDALAPDVAHAVLRCVQEGVTNAVRHAGADRVDVVVRRLGEGVSVEVRDDGAGAGRLVEGHGLTGLRERVRALGGEVDVDPGGGGRGLRLAVRLSGGGVPAAPGPRGTVS